MQASSCQPVLVLVAFLGLFALSPAGAESLPSCSDLFPLEISSPPAHQGVLTMVDVADRADDLSAVVVFDGVGPPAPILIEAGLDQAVYFAMPVHPADMMGGGSARLNLRIGQIECPPVQLTIEPMQPAPGASLRIIETMEASIVRQAGKLGYSRDLLLGLRQGDVPEDIFALAVALQMLGGPDNPNSARAAIADIGPELEIIDALMATMLADALDGVLLMIEHGPPPALGRTGRPGGGFAYASMGPALMGLSTGMRGISPELQANLTPAQLDALMAEQAEYAAVLTGTSGFAREAGGLALGAVGALSALGGPATAAVIGGSATFLGGVLTAHTIFTEYHMGALPSVMQQIDLEVSHSMFEEDSEQIGQWSASLTAMSTGYSVTLADLIGAVPGMGRVLGQGAKRLLKKQDIDLMELPPEADFILALLDFSRDGLAKFIGAHDDSGFEVLTPQAFTAHVKVDRSGERDYVQWSLLGADNAFALLADEHQYEARKAGNSELRLQTQPQRFQGQHRIANQVLTVEPIVVVVLGLAGASGPVQILPGDQVQLTATIENALDRTLQWFAPNGGTIMPLASTEEGGPFRAFFTAPETPGVYVVEAESMSRTGPRRSGQPRRVGVISLKAEWLRIDPTSICIEPGERAPFQAFYKDGPALTSDITWSADAGTITNAGLYTAPRAGRSATVTVEERTNPESRASATIRIGGCDCRWILSSSGYGRLEGETVSMTGAGVAALRPAPEPDAMMDILSMMQGMEDLMPPEALEAIKQAQAGLDSMPAGTAAYPATTFSLIAEDLPGVTVQWHLVSAGSDMGIFTMPNGMIYGFGEELETSFGSLQWSEIERGLIRGQFNARAGRHVSFDPEEIEWIVISGQFTMDPIPWQTFPGSPRMVGCPDPDPDD